ncbi:MAG TPA: YdeI/OmpD-associated family protein [Pseudonocardia sp.]|nr:YdeI/OmpD-associated family protein [Pseudonocardia sp.]
MSSGPGDAERFEPASVAEWRAWLAANHARRAGVWLVTRKVSAGGPQVGYAESVEQALCFGWIDSTGRALDDERRMLWFARRKPRSGWSRSNKQRIERLLAAGLMEPAGLALIEAAKADGSWTLLDAVEDLLVPDDLAAALDAHPGARENWEAFPPSARRALLEWIVQARRPDTRARRIAETAEHAARNERANQWRPKP